MSLEPNSRRCYDLDLKDQREGTALPQLHIWVSFFGACSRVLALSILVALLSSGCAKVKEYEAPKLPESELAILKSRSWYQGAAPARPPTNTKTCRSAQIALRPIARPIKRSVHAAMHRSANLSLLSEVDRKSDAGSCRWHDEISTL